MVRKDSQDQMERVFRRMGEPSWLILRALASSDTIPGIEVLKRVENWLEVADYPFKRLDPSTLHYALKRMEEDGLVDAEGCREVEVPGPRGSLRRELRTVFRITGLGAQALTRKDRLEAVALGSAAMRRAKGATA